MGRRRGAIVGDVHHATSDQETGPLPRYIHATDSRGRLGRRGDRVRDKVVEKQTRRVRYDLVYSTRALPKPSAQQANQRTLQDADNVSRVRVLRVVVMFARSRQYAQTALK